MDKLPACGSPETREVGELEFLRHRQPAAASILSLDTTVCVIAWKASGAPAGCRTSPISCAWKRPRNHHRASQKVSNRAVSSRALHMRELNVRYDFGAQLARGQLAEHWLRRARTRKMQKVRAN
eukprot:SAG31_NODE_2221_length_6156_cov_5.333994_3_plen_124_part_00